MLSDQGREFVAKVNDEICKELGIKKSVTSAYHPQTNGLDELTNQTDDSWLTDEHIDHAQSLLLKQYPLTRGLYSVLAFEGRNCKVHRGLKNVVQIINLGGKHWLTVSNIGCEPNQVKVYDSLYHKLPDSGRQKFARSVAMLINTNISNMSVQWVDMSKQKGSADCGLFAIASAVSLCHGQNPSECAFDQTVMREHLVLCFNCDEIAIFPSSPRNAGATVTEVIDLFCHCRMPYVSSSFMVECSKCEGWFHRSCDKVPKNVTAKTIYLCMNCK